MKAWQKKQGKSASHSSSTTDLYRSATPTITFRPDTPLTVNNILIMQQRYGNAWIRRKLVDIQRQTHKLEPSLYTPGRGLKVYIPAGTKKSDMVTIMVNGVPVALDNIRFKMIGSSEYVELIWINIDGVSATSEVTISSSSPSEDGTTETGTGAETTATESAGKETKRENYLNERDYKAAYITEILELADSKKVKAGVMDRGKLNKMSIDELDLIYSTVSNVASTATSEDRDNLRLLVAGEFADKDN